MSLKLLNNKVHPYAKTACTILSVIPKIIIAQKERDDAVYRLMDTINDVHLFIKDAKALESIESHRKVFVALGSLTVECAYLIRDYSMVKNFWERIANLAWSGVEAKINDYEDKFKALQAEFQRSAVVNIDITTMRCLQELPSDTSLIFNDLPYADGGAFDPDKSCIRGTRKAALDEIHEWINKEDGDDTPRIKVILGDAGVGKSAIANTVAQHYKAEKHLGSFVSFNRSDQEKRNPRNLLSTVARDMADLDSNWKSALYDVVKDDHSIRKTISPILQMKSFVLEPAKALAIVGPIVIIIDALDESGDALARRSLLKALAENASKLPPNFRILITARPEDDIRKLSEKLPNIQQQTIKTTDEAMDADITTYVTKELLEFNEDLEGNSRCSNGKGVNMLVKGSGHLFEWAATACRVIQNGRRGFSSARLLLDIVDNGGDLDELYTRILSQTFDAKSMPRFKDVLCGILAVKEPLPMASHSAIQQSESEEEDIVSMIVGPLGSLLHGVDLDESPQVPIRARHTSFFDFLTDEKRSKGFFVDATKQDQNLVIGCLRIMKKELQFNPCGLETSHVRNTDVPNLPTLVQTHLTPHLLYACRFFGVHLQTTPYQKPVGSKLNDFLHEHFLYWLEVLSLTKIVNTASRSLSSILKWSQSHNADLAAFAKDAKMFVNVFAPAISQSAPHIYLSALPFAPTLSLVSQKYLPKHPSTIHLKSGSVQSWPAALKTLEGHKDTVRAVAYSPDGSHIASGSSDETIRIWDAETGEAVGEPLRGHSSHILAIVYSPDGAYIVSGSSDNTIRIWDAETGESVGEPLRDHTGAIWAIAYSPDGRHIVSGSGDKTLRIWDVETREVVGEPLKGHTGIISSVAYCPDGTHIVSGSYDKMLRIWDAETGKAVGEPLSGHTDIIYAVVYSPDGRHVASGTFNGVIWIWDAETGKPIGNPIHRSKGENTHQVHSVAWSPNGKHIISGWTDGMIRVKDAETGEAIGKPFEGHTSQVNCVAYSPDRTGIVSCSHDGTVRVWNAEKSEAAGAQVAENTSEWNFVTYSPGGTRIVSASEGGMICVSDAETGSAVADSLKRNVEYEHHTMATTFSSDGMRVVSCDRGGGIQTWDSETGQSVGGTIKLGLSNGCSYAAFSFDGTRLAIQDSNQSVQVFNTETGMAMGMSSREYTGKYGVACIAYSPEGTHIALGFRDGSICVWDPETGKEVEWLCSKFQMVNSIAYSRDGKCLISGSYDCQIRMWNTETHTAVGELLTGHTEAVMTVVWSPDGKYIISGSQDQTIRVWNAETGEAVGGPLRGHSGSVTSIAYSPDGTRFASASTDKTIRFWDAQRVTAVSESNDTAPVFTDSSSLDNGWMLASSSDLLFWVPPYYRLGLVRPGNTAVIVAGGPVELDLTAFVHGTNWQQCRAL
ncbi:WD40 repeat-like protein [Athelia psychrophila]|uniref:WD40 repeat-like protein n=1 Tax=Athelia psychrophila TaxID=1759441 RepID=A0A165ZR00_9AGAM|nr:WD40 repeat-like protein [Fibularhizoctonia sp. CBS 109695]